MVLSTEDYKEALQQIKNEIAKGNDSTHYSGFYDTENIGKAKATIPILDSILNNKIGYDIDLEEILAQKKDEGTIDDITHMVLQQIIPTMIESKILENVRTMSVEILSWCMNNYVIRISDLPKESQMVLIHPASAEDASFRPIKNAIGTHWLALSFVLILFGINKVTTVIKENLGNQNHFLILLFSLEYLKNKLLKS